MNTSPIVKLDFTHSDGDGAILMRFIHEDGKQTLLPTLSKAMAMHAMAELALAIRDEYGPFNGIKA